MAAHFLLTMSLVISSDLARVPWVAVAVPVTYTGKLETTYKLFITITILNIYLPELMLRVRAAVPLLTLVNSS